MPNLQSLRDPSVAFTGRLGRFDAIYFTSTTFSTTGFGDIAPLSGTARRSVSSQILGDLPLLGVAVTLVWSRLSTAFGSNNSNPLADELRSDDTDTGY